METFTSHCTSSASPFVEQNPLDLWDSTSIVCAFRALLSFLLLWLVAELLPPVLLSEVGKVHSLWKDHSQLRRESKPLLDAVGVTVEPYNFEINDAFFSYSPVDLKYWDPLGAFPAQHGLLHASSESLSFPEPWKVTLSSIVFYVANTKRSSCISMLGWPTY